jgi:hypothetical protein
MSSKDKKEGKQQLKIVKESEIYKKSPKGFGIHFWQKRWLVLTPSSLYYFKTSNAPKPQGSSPISRLLPFPSRSHCCSTFCLVLLKRSLASSSFVVVAFSGGIPLKKVIFVIQPGKKNPNRFDIKITSNRIYAMKANSPEEAAEWVRSLGSF